jgi:hypothetical protein
MGGKARVGGAAAGGGGSHPTLGRPCKQSPANVPWPVIAGCLEPPTNGPYDFSKLRCAFPAQLNTPSYGPFIACCPLEEPFGCPNGTPQSCFATAAEAVAACGDTNCVACTAVVLDVTGSSGAGP